MINNLNRIIKIMFKINRIGLRICRRMIVYLINLCLETHLIWQRLEQEVTIENLKEIQQSKSSKEEWVSCYYHLNS